MRKIFLNQKHDPEYSPSDYILLPDSHANVEEDEPMPDFEGFLHPKVDS